MCYEYKTPQLQKITIQKRYYSYYWGLVKSFKKEKVVISFAERRLTFQNSREYQIPKDNFFKNKHKALKELQFDTSTVTSPDDNIVQKSIYIKSWTIMQNLKTLVRYNLFVILLN